MIRPYVECIRPHIEGSNGVAVFVSNIEVRSSVELIEENICGMIFPVVFCNVKIADEAVIFFIAGLSILICCWVFLILRVIIICRNILNIILFYTALFEHITLYGVKIAVIHVGRFSLSFIENDEDIADEFIRRTLEVVQSVFNISENNAVIVIAIFSGFYISDDLIHLSGIF